jgi:hypothetical protein
MKYYYSGSSIIDLTDSLTTSFGSIRTFFWVSFSPLVNFRSMLAAVFPAILGKTS